MPLEPGGSDTRHARSTLVATGGSPWANGTVDVFTITGRVWIKVVTAFCTESLASAGGGTIELGHASDPNELIAQATATDVDVNEFWVSGTTSPGDQINTTSIDVVLSLDVILTVGTADVTDGTIIFDCWYVPITDGASLVAA